jgi:hypothetical protein
VDQLFLIEGVGRRIGCEVENFELLFQFVPRDFGLAVVRRATAVGRGLSSIGIAPMRGQPLRSWEFGPFG